MAVQRYTNKPYPRLSQGDILKEVPHVVLVESGETRELQEIEEAFVVVVGQDCDLKWHAELGKDKHDKQLLDVIVLPAYLSGLFKEGGHLGALGLRVDRQWGNTDWKNLQSNKDERFHLLKQEGTLPELVIDFKRYYTLPVAQLEQMANNPEKYLTSLAPLFRAQLSQRFANFLSRIPVPDELDTPAPAVEQEETEDTAPLVEAPVADTAV